jgi:hypothetical protein
MQLLDLNELLFERIWNLVLEERVQALSVVEDFDVREERVPSVGTRGLASGRRDVLAHREVLVRVGREAELLGALRSDTDSM